MISHRNALSGAAEQNLPPTLMITNVTFPIFKNPFNCIAPTSDVSLSLDIPRFDFIGAFPYMFRLVTTHHYPLLYPTVESNDFYPQPVYPAF